MQKQNDMKNLENNNKPMPSQEIGLYRMAKEVKAIKEAKHMMNKTMVMANAIAMAKKMK